MKLLPVFSVGLILSFLTAFLAGYCIAMAFPLGPGTPLFYAAELMGIVISLTVFYLVVRKGYRRNKRHADPYRERLA